MHTCVRKALQIAVTAGGLMFLGAGIASADSTDVTGDLTAAVQAELGVDLDLDLGQLPQAVDVPITISGNEISILTSPAADENDSDAGQTADESDAVIDVPITVTDNTVTVLGDTDNGSTDNSSGSGDTEHRLRFRTRGGTDRGSDHHHRQHGDDARCRPGVECGRRTGGAGEPGTGARYGTIDGCHRPAGDGVRHRDRRRRRCSGLL